MDEKSAIYYLQNLAVVIIPILLAFVAYMQQQIDKRFHRLERRLDIFEEHQDRREELAQDKFISILQKLAKMESR